MILFGVFCVLIPYVTMFNTGLKQPLLDRVTRRLQSAYLPSADSQKMNVVSLSPKTSPVGSAPITAGSVPVQSSALPPVFTPQSTGSSQYLISDVTFGCPNGWETVGNICRRLAVQDALIGCPGGYQLTDAFECLKTEMLSPMQVCPTEYFPDVSSGKTVCYKIMNSDKLLLCPDGYTLGEVSCERKITGTKPVDGITCPSGFVVGKNGYCSGIIQVTPTAICPNNYIEVGDGTVCELIQYTEPTRLCLTGYNMNRSNFCEKQSKTDFGIICPTGFKMAENGESCYVVEETEYQPSCPNGWTYDGIAVACLCIRGACPAYETSLQAQIQYEAAMLADRTSTTTTSTLPYIRGGMSYAYGAVQPAPPEPQEQFLGIGANGGSVVQVGPQVFEIVTVELPAVAAQTVYYPEVVTLPDTTAIKSPKEQQKIAKQQAKDFDERGACVNPNGCAITTASSAITSTQQQLTAVSGIAYGLGTSTTNISGQTNSKKKN